MRKNQGRDSIKLTARQIILDPIWTRRAIRVDIEKGGLAAYFFNINEIYDLSTVVDTNVDFTLTPGDWGPDSGAWFL